MEDYYEKYCPYWGKNVSYANVRPMLEVDDRILELDEQINLILLKVRK